MLSGQSSKIRVLYVITQGEMGGAQRYVFDLVTHIADRGEYEIIVAIGEGGGDFKIALQQKDIPVRVLKHLRRNIHPLSEVLALFEIKNLIKEWQPDIIHLNSSKAGVLGSLAARLAGSPNVIFTAHGFAFLEPRWFQLLYFWAEKFASMFRKKIITVSEYDRQEAIINKLCSPRKLITIHNGITFHPHLTSPIKGEESSLTSLPLVGRAREGGKITIGTIAHDYPTKDLKTLRKAFAILKKEFSNAELVIVGRGGTTGEVPDAASWLSDFDIYVCSSVKEGFPYIILEAMAAGLPIVSTDVGGIPEMLTGEMKQGVGGILVPPRNPEALARAIKKLITDKQLVLSLGERAKQKVKQFSLNKMMEQTAAVYREVIS